MVLRYLMIALMSLSCNSCKSLFSDEGSSSESSIKSVMDETYLLKLSQSGQEGYFRFEVCLIDDDESCVGGLRTDQGEDLVFSAEIIDKARLSENQALELKKVHDEYHNYNQAISRGLGTHISQFAGGSSIVIGGGILGQKLHKYGVKLNNDLRDIDRELYEVKGDTLGDHMFNVKNTDEQARLMRLKQSLEYRAQMTQTGFLQKEFGSSTLMEVDQKLSRYEKQITSAGLNTTKTPQPVPAKYFHTVEVGLKKYKTIFSQSFIDFYFSRIPQTNPDLSDYAEAMDRLLGQGKVYDAEQLIKMWAQRGYTDIQMIHKPFRPQLERFFVFNHIESLVNPHSSGRVARNMDEFTAAVISGNKQLLKAAQRFSHHRGVSPIAVSRIKWIQRYRAIVPDNRVSLLALESGSMRPKVLDRQTSELLKEVSEKLAPINEAVEGAQKRADIVRRYQAVSDDVVRHLDIASKGLIGITMGRVLGAGIAFAGLVGFVFHVVDPRNSASTADYEAAKPIIDRYDKLQVMIDQSSPLMSTDPDVQQQVPSVVDLLFGLAIWQNTISVASADVVVSDICLPVRSQNGDSECQSAVSATASS